MRSCLTLAVVVALLGCSAAPAPAPAPAADEAPEQRAARCAALEARSKAPGATFEVQPATPLPGNPAPAYPLGQGAPPAGRVVLQFVVDTAGAVVPATVRAREATHPALEAAARATVAGWRFRAATLAPGCPVRFQVTAPFEFRHE